MRPVQAFIAPQIHSITVDAHFTFKPFNVNLLNSECNMKNKVQTAHAKMVVQLCQPGETILSKITASKMHVLHAAVGLIGEAVELLTLFDGLNTQEEKVEELGDAIFYLRALLQSDLLSADDLADIDRAAELLSESKLPYNYMESVHRVLHGSGLVLDGARRIAIQDNMAKGMPRLKAGLLQTLEAWGVAVRHLGVKVFDSGSVRLLDGDDVLQANLDKLLTGANARYAEGVYSDQAAGARADKVGKNDDV